MAVLTVASKKRLDLDIAATLLCRRCAPLLAMGTDAVRDEEDPNSPSDRVKSPARVGHRRLFGRSGRRPEPTGDSAAVSVRTPMITRSAGRNDKPGGH